MTAVWKVTVPVCFLIITLTIADAFMFRRIQEAWNMQMFIARPWFKLKHEIRRGDQPALYWALMTNFLLIFVGWTAFIAYLLWQLFRL